MSSRPKTRIYTGPVAGGAYRREGAQGAYAANGNAPRSETQRFSAFDGTGALSGNRTITGTGATGAAGKMRGGSIPRHHDTSRRSGSFDGAVSTRKSIQAGRMHRADIPNGRRAAPHTGTAIFAKPRRGRKLPLAIAVFAIALAAALAARPTISRFFGKVTNPDGLAQESDATSTPRSEWKRGSVPFLYQIDPQWADEPYAGGNIRKNGCGPTALSMVYIALTGHTDLDPATMAAFSEQYGHVSDNMTAWTLMTDGAAQLGLASEELSASSDVLARALTTGKPVICSVRPGDFTTTGHYIVLSGIDENGQLIVHDPNSAERSAQRWDIDRVLSQCANLWAFSVA